MNRSRFYYPLFISLLSAWLVSTTLVDFFIVPTTFKVVESFFNAGDLAIAVFSQFNCLELIMGSGLVIISGQMAKEKKNPIPLVFCLLLWVIAMIYFGWLTPKLQDLTELWKKADFLGQIGAAQVADIQQEHQKYHRLYVSIDGLKLLLLATLWSYAIFKEDRCR